MKLIQPAHVSGAYWVPAPYGLADFLPASSCAVTLTCDGESGASPGRPKRQLARRAWRRMARVRRRPEARAGRRAPHQGAGTQAQGHRAQTRARRRAAPLGGTLGDEYSRRKTPRGAAPRARRANEPEPLVVVVAPSQPERHLVLLVRGVVHHLLGDQGGVCRGGFPHRRRVRAPRRQARGGGDGARRRPGPAPRERHRARDARVYSRRRLGRTDDAAVDDASAPRGALETVAEMARPAVGVSRRAVVPPPGTTADDDAKASAAPPPPAPPAMPATRTRAAPADRRAGAERREETTVETLRLRRLGRRRRRLRPRRRRRLRSRRRAPPRWSPRRAWRTKRPSARGGARRETTPCPIAETPGETPWGSLRAPRGGVGPRRRRRENAGVRRAAQDRRRGRGTRRRRRGRRRRRDLEARAAEADADARLVRHRAAQFEGWTTPAPAKAAAAAAA